MRWIAAALLVVGFMFAGSDSPYFPLPNLLGTATMIISVWFIQMWEEI